MQHLERPALVVIDVQRGFDDTEFWGERDNPACEGNIAALIAAWRTRDWPIVVVQHASLNPDSPLHPSNPGHALKAAVTVDPDLLVTKYVNSGFYGSPDLHDWLTANQIRQVVICGITTNHCCDTTARMAGNLGYDTYFAIDATHTFDRVSPDGVTISAKQLSQATATNLHGEFATVVTTAELLDATIRSEQEQIAPDQGPR